MPTRANCLTLLLAGGVMLTGCTAGGQATATVHYLDAPFTHSIQIGAVTVAPPAIGEQPLVPVTEAQYIAQHPATWLGGARHNDLVAFGYGRVAAPTLTAKGTAPFRRGQLAWVAVYRASANSIMFNGCLAGPAYRAGYHIVPASPRPEQFSITVLINAITGAQATALPLFSDVCPHLVRNG